MTETSPSTRERPSVEHRLLLLFVSIKFALLIVVGGRYGIHRDELYYLMGGRHLDFGYVDHPFVVPWLAALSERLFGLSLIGLRLFSTLASSAVLYLAGVMTAYLGGGRRAQLLAALATLLTPFHLMAQNLFQTVPIDQLTWAIALLTLVMLFRSGDSRWWLAFGAASGIGLLTKYTFLALGAGAVVGIVLTARRRELARPWIYLGGMVALLIVLPNLLWQVEHGWPTLEFITNNSARDRFSSLAFLGLQTVFMGPFSLPLFVCGFLFFFSKKNTGIRPLGYLAATIFLALLIAQSKPYYTTALYPLLFAGGAVFIEERSWGGSGRQRKWMRYWPYLLVLGNVLMVPVFMPVLPLNTYAQLHNDFPHPEFGEMIGWPELVETVGDFYQALPEDVREHTIIVTSNYGSAAAIDLFGERRGLPRAFCFQNSYYLWSEPTSIDSVLAVSFHRQTLETYFAEVIELGVITNDAGVDNEEAGRSVFLASQPLVGARELRETLRRFF